MTGIFIALLLFVTTEARSSLAPQQEESSGQSNTVTAHIKVSAEGLDKLPKGSTVELKGDPATCKDVHRTQNIQSGEATFKELQKCKIDLRFFIPGLDSQMLSVDFAEYREPLRILITPTEARLVE